MHFKYDNPCRAVFLLKIKTMYIFIPTWHVSFEIFPLTMHGYEPVLLALLLVIFQSQHQGGKYWLLSFTDVFFRWRYGLDVVAVKWIIYNNLMTELNDCIECVNRSQLRVMRYRYSDSVNTRHGDKRWTNNVARQRKASYNQNTRFKKILVDLAIRYLPLKGQNFQT